MNADQRRRLAEFLGTQRLGPLAQFLQPRYVDLRVSAQDTDVGEIARSEFPTEEPPISAAPRLFGAYARSLLSRPGRHAVLVGVSGAGKTVTLGRLAADLSHAAITSLEAGANPGAIPVWCPAASLPEEQVQKPVDWFAGVLQHGGVFAGSEALAEELLDSGRAVLLMDSVHEASSVLPGQLDNVCKLFRLPGVTVVATSRPGFHAVLEGAAVQVVHLHGFGRAERERLMEMNEVTPPQADALRRFELRPRLQGAVEVPQIWQMAIDLCRSGVDLDPIASEAVLYREFIERFGDTECRTLTGCDWTKAEDRARYRQEGIGENNC